MIEIGQNKPFVIAEIGNNHDGSFDNAKTFIKAVAEDGARLETLVFGKRAETSFVS